MANITLSIILALLLCTIVGLKSTDHNAFYGMNESHLSILLEEKMKEAEVGSTKNTPIVNC